MECRKVALRGNDGEEGKNGVPIPRNIYLGIGTPFFPSSPSFPLKATFLHSNSIQEVNFIYSHRYTCDVIDSCLTCSRTSFSIGNK